MEPPLRIVQPGLASNPFERIFMDIYNVLNTETTEFAEDEAPRRKFRVPRHVWQDFRVPPQSLVSYVRNKKGNTIGVMVARKIDGEVRFGITKWKKSSDEYSGRFGLKVAFDRINVGKPIPAQLPFGFEEAFPKFQERARKYFKV